MRNNNKTSIPKPTRITQTKKHSGKVSTIKNCTTKIEYFYLDNIVRPYKTDQMYINWNLNYNYQYSNMIHY